MLSQSDHSRIRTIESQSEHENSGATVKAVSAAASSRGSRRSSKIVIRKAELELKLLSEKHKLENEVREAMFRQQLAEAEAKLALAEIECDSDNEDGLSHCSLVSGMERVKTYLKETAPEFRAENVVRELPCTTEGLGGLELPRLELIQFDGNAAEYWRFKRQFDSLFDRIQCSDNRKLSYLLHYCKGMAREAIEPCVLMSEEKGYRMARKILDELFDRPQETVRAIVNDVMEKTSELSSTPEGLSRLSIKLRSCHLILVEMGCESELDSLPALESLVSRLPRRLQRTWAERASKLTANKGRYKFSDIAEMIDEESRIQNSPFGRLLEVRRPQDPPIDRRRSFPPRRDTRINAIGARLGTESISLKNECPLCQLNHSLVECEQFRKLSASERRQMVAKLKACYQCTKIGHLARECKEIVKCSVIGCTGRHHSLLHLSNSDQLIATVHSTATGTHCVNTTAYLGVVPVRLFNGEKSTIAYALIDSGSDTTLVSEEVCQLLGLKGPEIIMNVRTISGEQTMACNRVSFEVSSLEGSKNIVVNTAFTLNDQLMPRAQVPSESQMAGLNHLKGIKQHCLNDPRVKVIIGCDVPQAHWVLNQRYGRPTELFAVETPLGWLIMGPGKGSSTYKQIGCIRRDEEIRLMIENLYDKGFDDLHEIGANPSEEDRQAIIAVEQSIEHNEGRFCVSLTWRTTPDALPNNHELVMRRLECLKRRFLRDPELFVKYKEILDDHLRKGYIDKVPPQQLDNRYKPRWYLPHHPVINPKKPGKLRVVFDCAATFEGKSLNNHLLSGPNTVANLVGVLLRFRMGQVAVAADVQEMFLQVKVPERDSGALRFLWWPDGKLDAQPAEYRILVHPFGATSSPFCANFALKRAVETFANVQETRVSNAIDDNFYVDDCLAAFDDTEQAKRFSLSLRQALSLGGFRLCKWVSNKYDAIKDIPETERTSLSLHIRINREVQERTLGMNWVVKDDVFVFPFESSTKPFTKRGLLSYVSSLYDPLGLVTPMLLTGRLLLQLLHRKGLSWDEWVGEEEQKSWESWIADVKELRSFKIPRYVGDSKPQSTDSMELHIFCDASESAYGAAAYLRRKSNETYTFNLIMAKFRIAPLKTVTIPRLELAAAVVAVKLGSIVTRELRLDGVPTLYWTDSMIVVYYLHNVTARYSTYVANRLTVIREHSETRQWNHVKGTHNPADHGTRGLKANDSRWDSWFHGPLFLRKTYEIEPPQLFTEALEDGIELKRTAAVNQLRTVELNKILSHYSDWGKLLRAVSWLRRFSRFIHLMFGKNTTLSMTLGRLTADEIGVSVNTVLKIVQTEAFPIEYQTLNQTGGCVGRNSPLRKLNPIMVDGILRVGGRLQYVHLPLEAKHPAILPPRHNVTAMLIRHYHMKEGHMGPQHVLTVLREKFWIVKGGAAVKRVINTCVHCRRQSGRFGNQIMAPIPISRVDVSSPPFTSVGVDYFGPFYVKRGRSLEKRYGCIFTCMTMRAVHLEVVHSYSTASFVMALDRFMARRGKPKDIYSDNGSNFIGTMGELKACLKSWSQGVIHDHLMRDGVQWHFNPPRASHRGGVWERLIKIVKRILTSIMRSTPMTDEVLVTALVEAERIMNNRPLVPIQNDSQAGGVLTPKMLLLIGSHKQDDSQMEWCDRYNRRWKEVQQISLCFWKRWTKEYLPLLQTRSKWYIKQRDFQKGDVVILVKDNRLKNEWPLGLVVETKLSEDGHVREVEVKTSKGVVRRDIRGICLLEGVLEEQKVS